MMLPFHRALKKYILEAFTRREISPEAVAKTIARAMRRPCGKREGEAFAQWLSQREVKYLVHFTPLQNLPTIMSLGLIAREYLQYEAIRLALHPGFSDDYRLDGMPNFNCLSITSPNYAMFYGKRNRRSGRWAVIEFDARVLTEIYFDFTPTNAASSNVAAVGGVNGAERLFMLPELRAKLGLLSCETTDPQAEALCDSILPPSYVRAVYVEHDSDAVWLKRKGISCIVDPTHFRQRRDWQFWQGRKIVDLPEAQAFLSLQTGG